ncbi:hypothetical protein PR003_g9669 [Phytophthora rubi]|uniref:Reverse transcriptase domain-containing protein n=1 Tax=Phytophthora rubi TaxID=129364 RepID=A0A6A4FFQ0_9STRA|nr:hypothetical protein PR003_g9669 [Phytophthora rubi]
MELGPASDLLLGRDHLAALGISVSKLPFTAAAATAATAPLPEEDEADCAVLGSTPECIATSPLTYAHKKLPDGRKIDIRTCFDARGVNVILVVVDKHPLPLIKETQTGFKCKRFVSALDLKWSFHQFIVALCDRSKLSFTWEGVQYCFNGCRFGLTSVSHHVQRVSQGALHDLYYCCRVFIDDITIFSDILEHVEDIRAVLSRLNDINLKLRTDKCHFVYPAIRSLGFLLSGVGTLPNDVKVQELLAFPTPTTGTQVSSFLGIVNFFWDHTPGVAHISAPLEALRNMKGSLLERWTPWCEAAFQRLKDCRAQAPRLHHYDDKLPLFLACDTPNVGVGAVLFQRSETEDFWLLASFLSTLKGGQRNCSATQRELLAVIYGMRKCHDILWGRPFTL